VGWEFEAEVVVEAPAARVRRCLPRALGSLTEIDSERCRLSGTTSNPVWYAEQLAMLPAPYRIAGGPELRDAAQEIGRRMLDAAG
jgi:hypothetical protein